MPPSRRPAMLLVLFVATLTTPAVAVEEGVIKYLDALKTCRPTTLRYPNPMVPGFTNENVIKGMQDGKCGVTMVMPGSLTMDCAFTPATVRLLTDERHYEDARQDRFTNYPDVDQKFNEECQFR